MTQPDLFVVCKNCGSEVSPYVTECPYCGQRVRKRAPKLDKGAPGEPKPARRRSRLPRLRPDEIEGIAPDTRPWATLALIAAALVMTFIYAADQSLDIGQLVVPGLDEVWRWAVAPFIHQDALGYEFVTLIATGIFGTLLERRFGPVPVLIIFLASGFAGCALAVQLEIEALLSANQFAVVLGANGAALGLLAAWYVDDRVAARRGADRENDLLGVYVIAAVLLLLSVAVEEANIAAAVGGALAGGVLGLGLPLFTKR